VIDSVPVPNPNFWNDIDAGAASIWVTTSPIVHEDGVPLVELYGIDPVTGTVETTVGVGGGTNGLRVALGLQRLRADPRPCGHGNDVVVETLPVGSCCSAAYHREWRTDTERCGLLVMTT
jgi:hypothetical protein